MAKTRNPDELLLRVRRELARAPRIPERTLLFAGDPRKPVRRISARQTLSKLGLAAGAGCVAALLFSVWRGRPADARGESVSLVSSGRSLAAPPIAMALAATADERSPATPPAVTSPSPAPSEPPVSHDASAAPPPEHFTVEVVNTRKVVEVVLSGPASEPSEESYRALRHELRSTTTGAENPIDPRLIELLHAIAKRTGGTVQVLSAFRAPKSLRDSNYHTRGMAADVRVPGLSAAGVRDLARSLGAHGVGYYPTSAFVHVDVREEPFFWTDTSGPGQSQEDQHAAYTDNAARTKAPEASASPQRTPTPDGAPMDGDAGAPARAPASPSGGGEDGALATGATGATRAASQSVDSAPFPSSDHQ